MSNRDQGIGPRKSSKSGPTIHDVRVDNSPVNPEDPMTTPDATAKAGHTPEQDRPVIQEMGSLLIAYQAERNYSKTLKARVEELEGALRGLVYEVLEEYHDWASSAMERAKAALRSATGEGVDSRTTEKRLRDWKE